MLEMMLQKPPSGVYYGNSGPGPKTLKYGTLQLGYFGTVTQAEMFTGPELSNRLGLSAGVDISTAAMYWWKFAYKGKFLFIPSQQLKNYISWNELYGAGAVYGTKSNGAYPASPAVYQYNPVVKVDGSTFWSFIPRLMTGWPDPTYPGVGLDAYPQSSDSEWQQLVGRMCTSANGNIAEKWDAKSPDLISIAATMQSWTQETQATDVTKANNRGYTYNAYAIVGSVSNTKTYNTGPEAMWRPVLELTPLGTLLDPQSTVLVTSPIPQPPAIVDARNNVSGGGDLSPLLDPVNVVTVWPTKQPVISGVVFTGAALDPVNVTVSGSVSLNGFTIAATPSQLAYDPVNLTYSLADLNPFALSGSTT